MDGSVHGQKPRNDPYVPGYEIRGGGTHHRHPRGATFRMSLSGTEKMAFASLTQEVFALDTAIQWFAWEKGGRDPAVPGATHRLAECLRHRQRLIPNLLTRSC